MIIEDIWTFYELYCLWIGNIEIFGRQHQQILDSLSSEHQALLDAGNVISWEDFLGKKLNDRMGNEVEKIINTELNSLR